MYEFTSIVSFLIVVFVDRGNKFIMLPVNKTGRPAWKEVSVQTVRRFMAGTEVADIAARARPDTRLSVARIGYFAVLPRKSVRSACVRCQISFM
jgi:hypothetical protein